jgi:hypothetical protein
MIPFQDGGLEGKKVLEKQFLNRALKSFSITD